MLSTSSPSSKSPLELPPVDTLGGVPSKFCGFAAVVPVATKFCDPPGSTGCPALVKIDPGGLLWPVAVGMVNDGG